MDEKYYVYWYKRPTFTNPYIEGYIGITNNLKRRDLEHKRNKKFTHFSNALKLYNDIERVILHECCALDALQLEQTYRPEKNIAWNMAAGGEDTLASWGRVPISLYHKDSYPILHSFRSIFEAAEALQIGEDRISIAKSRGVQVYGKDGWAILLDPVFDRSMTPTYGDRISQGITGLIRDKPSHFKGKTDRWSPEERLRIGTQHKGKVLSKEQKAQLKLHNQLHNPACKQIQLSHSDNPDIIYTFRSIGEASRELNINRSGLKYAVLQPLPYTNSKGWTILNLGSE
jgi:predicted GIY-YIG superfamily endonuclease